MHDVRTANRPQRFSAITGKGANCSFTCGWCDMLRALFEAENLEVSDAENGAECIQKAQDVKPGLIILDLSMPVMNGLEAAKALKVLMPHVPLLMFTNHAGVVLEKEACSAGIFAVVSKSDSNSTQQLLAHAKTLLGFNESGVQRAS